MSDRGDKLTWTDVQALISRASNPSAGPALAAMNTLRETVSAGESAFVDQNAYYAARRAVEAF